MCSEELAKYHYTELLATTFDDVCIEPEIIDGLRNIISLPLLFPDQFAQGALAKQTGCVLLYGPPGTGKTILCQALAYECGAQMIILKPSDINDKYIGESEKLVSSVFVSILSFRPVVFLTTVEFSQASFAVRYFYRRGRYAVFIAVR